MKIRVDPESPVNYEPKRSGTRCFVGAESEDWSENNAVRSSVSIDGAATFGVRLR